jgi:hypothetical protein
VREFAKVIDVSVESLGRLARLAETFCDDEVASALCLASKSGFLLTVEMLSEFVAVRDPRERGTLLAHAIIRGWSIRKAHNECRKRIGCVNY